MEKEITKLQPLFTEAGDLNNPGYAKQMMFEYDRGSLKSGPLALKEWDFYQIGLGDDVLQLTIGHVSYIASFSAKLISLKTGEVLDFSRMKPFPLKSMNMPTSPNAPNVVEAAGKDYAFRFDSQPTYRHLTIKGTDKKIGDIDLDITIQADPKNEKMVIATPFEKKKQFYLNCKENFFGAKGTIRFGQKNITLSEKNTSVLDWGRGVWPFKQEWFWGNGTAYMDGGRFAFNIGWGFGDLSNATENMFFWNGKAHKLGSLIVERDENDYMAPWHFTDETGNLDLTMTPVHDHFSKTEILFIKTQCHQVHGKFNGTATLPDGKKIKVVDMLAFCEHAENQW